jgi:opacity protein-like surface antigen
MPYVTGGYAVGNFENSSRASAPPNALFDTGHTRNDGWYIGGGVEWAVSPGWSAGLEYRHYEFDAVDVRLFTPLGQPSGDFRHVDPTTDTIAARVSWRWGRPEAAPLK